MRSLDRFVTATAVLSAMLASAAAIAAEPSQGWRHTVFLYGMGAGMDGTAQVGDVRVPVDASISDVLSNLEFGAMAAYRAENDTWSVTADVTYMGLGGTVRSQGGHLKGDVDVDQVAIMGTVGRRLTEHLEGLASLAYFDLSSDLVLTTTAPVSGEVTKRKAGTDADWIDPLIGLQYAVPVGDSWRATLRGDIGGFGIGSDLSYQVLASLGWRASDTVGVFFGYRIIGFDYEDGHGASYQRYDLTEHGPLAGVSVAF